MTTSALPLQILRFSVLVTAIVLCLLTRTGHAASTLVINGVDGRLEENIRLLVAQPPEKENERQFQRYIDGLPKQVVAALSAYGYYAADATVSVAEVAPPRPKSSTDELVDKVTGTIAGKASTAPQIPENVTSVTQITIDVVRNEPIRIRRLELQIIDLDADNTDFNETLTAGRQNLAVDNVFVSADYESAKSSLLSTAQRLGYFDFEFTQTQVRVSRRAFTADIVITANAGARFTFGDILYKQQTFSETFMSRWTPFKTGDPYEAALIGELTQNLQSSGYFSGVRVRPLVDPRYGQTVPITVDLTKRDSNQVSTGIGYSSDTKLRTKLTWGKPLLNSRGHSAEYGLSLAKDLKRASFAYRIPRRNQPLYNYWGIEFGMERDTHNNLDSLLGTLNFQRVTRKASGWSESIFLRWQRERFETLEIESQPGAVGQPDIERTVSIQRETDLVMPGVSYSRSRSKGEPFTTWGQALSFQVMGGSDKALSSINFIKAFARFRYLRALSDRNTIIATAQYGVLHSNDYDNVPFSQRFFAGGDRTVRGFGYRQIAPRNPVDQKPEGGRFLEVTNLEYNYRFRDRWSGAVFVDAGRAFNRHSTQYSMGAGIGLRWQSPVGPFRIDIARPIQNNDENVGDGFRVHISLGPDL